MPSSLKSLRFVFFALTLQLDSLVKAADNFPSALEPAPVNRFSVNQTALYANAHTPIKALVLAENKFQVVNHFCIIGYTWPSGSQTAWVHWSEQQRLILWEPSLDANFNKKSLIHSRRDLSYQTDTVDRPADINGSTYLVTKDWWQAVAQDCAKHGQKITTKAIKSFK
jgi:hypothetical protein